MSDLPSRRWGKGGHREKKDLSCKYYINSFSFSVYGPWLDGSRDKFSAANNQTNYRTTINRLEIILVATTFTFFCSMCV